MTSRTSFLSAFFVLGSALSGGTSYALDIPLKESKTPSTRVGFVDMERIFREYPDTQKAKLDYQRTLERLKAELAIQEQQQFSIDDPGGVSEPAEPLTVSSGALATPSGDPLLSSTEAATSPAPPLPTAGDLEKKRAALDDARRAAAQELRDFETKRSQLILGTLYKALAQLAEERGVHVVVDKSAILFGQEAVDLTEALNRKLRGLPEETAP